MNMDNLTAEEEVALTVTPAIAIRLIQVMDAFSEEIWGDKDLSEHPKLQAALKEAGSIDRALWDRLAAIGIES